MLLTPLAIATGLALGLARGGSLAGLRALNLRYWPLIVVGVVLQSAEQWGDVPLRLTLLIIGLFLLVVSTMANVHLKGAAITGIGLTLNLAVVVVNGHVPLRVEALKAVGGMPADADPAGYTVNGLWRFEDDDTALRFLGDIVPVTFFEDVISFGDLILLAGLVVLFMNLLLRRPRHGVMLDELLSTPQSFDLRDRTGLDPASDQRRPADSGGPDPVGGMADAGAPDHLSAGRPDHP
jgi:hypothetical protein